MSDLVILLEEIEAYQKDIQTAINHAKHTGDIIALEAIASHVRDIFDSVRYVSYEPGFECNCCLPYA